MSLATAPEQHTLFVILSEAPVRQSSIKILYLQACLAQTGGKIPLPEVVKRFFVS
jgi:hypothetical protein